MNWLLPPMLFPDFWLTVGIYFGAVAVIVLAARMAIDLLRELRRKGDE